MVAYTQRSIAQPDAHRKDLAGRVYLLEAQTRTEAEAKALPPGLYGPSSEHMTHALFRDPVEDLLRLGDHVLG